MPERMHTKMLIIPSFGWWYLGHFNFLYTLILKCFYKKHFLKCEPPIVQNRYNYSPYWELGVGVEWFH